MAPGRINGDRSALAMFAAELRAARTRAGLSRDDLAARINYSGSLVGMIESMIRVPTLRFSQRLDEVLQTTGTFGRMQEHLRAAPFPAWFRDWVEAEREATSLRTWEPMLVPGLLQTADYARAILGAGPEAVADEVEQMVSARMDRQSILDRDAPPLLWVVLDEAVLHRCVGSPKIMHEQLLHLAEMAGRPRVTVQVVPARTGTHAGLLGAFIVASSDGASDIVYLETSADGQVSDMPRVVAQVMLRFDILRAAALPRDDSRDLLLKAVQKWNRT
jgi:transcriptional regulator with XRE-family HTH domain